MEVLKYTFIQKLKHVKIPVNCKHIKIKPLVPISTIAILNVHLKPTIQVKTVLIATLCV